MRPDSNISHFAATYAFLVTRKKFWEEHMTPTFLQMLHSLRQGQHKLQINELQFTGLRVSTSNTGSGCDWVSVLHV